MEVFGEGVVSVITGDEKGQKLMTMKADSDEVTFRDLDESGKPKTSTGTNKTDKDAEGAAKLKRAISGVEPKTEEDPQTLNARDVMLDHSSSQKILIGDDNKVEGRLSEIRGDYNEIFSDGNFVFGNFCIVHSSHSELVGDDCKVFGSFNLVRGKRNVIYGPENEVRGDENEIQASFNTVYGKRNRIYGPRNYVEGEENEIHSADNKVLGQRNKIFGGANEVYEPSEVGADTFFLREISGLGGMRMDGGGGGRVSGVSAFGAGGAGAFNRHGTMLSMGTMDFDFSRMGTMDLEGNFGGAFSRQGTMDSIGGIERQTSTVFGNLLNQQMLNNAPLSREQILAATRNVAGGNLMLAKAVDGAAPAGAGAPQLGGAAPGLPGSQIPKGAIATDAASVAAVSAGSEAHPGIAVSFIRFLPKSSSSHLHASFHVSPDVSPTHL